jgi:hypothetical protein
MRQKMVRSAKPSNGVFGPRAAPTSVRNAPFLAASLHAPYRYLFAFFTKLVVAIK